MLGSTNPNNRNPLLLIYGARYPIEEQASPAVQQNRYTIASSTWSTQSNHRLADCSTTPHQLEPHPSLFYRIAQWQQTDPLSVFFFSLHSHTALLRLGILNQLHDLDRLRLQFLRLSLNFGSIRVCGGIGLIEDIIVGQDDLVDDFSELFLRFPDFDLVVGGCDELVACNDDLERSERAVLVEYNIDDENKKRERL